MSALTDKATTDALSFIGESLSQSETVNPVFAQSIRKALTDDEREAIQATRRVEHTSIY